MKKNILIISLLVIAVVAVVQLKNRTQTGSSAECADGICVLPFPQEKMMPDGVVAEGTSRKALPKLLDLGAGKCASCKAMTVVLDEMTETFAGQLEVEFIDVWENEGVSEQYGIRIIPVQIFFDAETNELFRHEGFYAREDILAKWSELGYAFEDQGEVESSLFASISSALAAVPAIALGAALLWGILSVLLSPCHLASIPLIVGFIDKQGKTTPKRALVISLLFSLGILVTIAIIGVATAAAGRVIGDLGQNANYFVSIIFFVVGLHLLGIVPLGWNKPGHAGENRKGLFAAFLLGLVFGIALGPCSFAYMAPLLGVSFKLGADQPIYAGALLLMFGLGHCGVIALAGVSTSWVQTYRDWNLKSKSSLKLKRICGILVIFGGLYLIYTAH